MMDVNFIGSFYGARAALPIFRAQGRGHLIFVSSIVGRRGIPFMSGYSATKAAQASFAESLRSEFAGTDIHISAVFPVSTDTEFRDAMERDFGHDVSGLGPKQSVDQVAHAIVECFRRPRPEVYPHGASRGSAILNALAPGLHRSPGPPVRPAARRLRHAPDASSRRCERAGHPCHEPRHGDHDRAPGARRRRPRAHRRRLGARSPAVAPSKDVDVEVYGIAADRLKPLLRRSAPVNTVGESFTVYKVARRRRRAAAPRVEDRPRASRVRGRRRPGHVAGRGRAAPRFHRQRDLLGSADRTNTSIRSTAAAICSSAGFCAPSIRAPSATTACACCAASSSRPDSASRWMARPGTCAATSRSTICRPNGSGAKSRSCCSSPTGRRSGLALALELGVDRSLVPRAEGARSAARRNRSGIPKATSGCTRCSSSTRRAAGSTVSTGRSSWRSCSARSATISASRRRRHSSTAGSARSITNRRASRRRRRFLDRLNVHTIDGYDVAAAGPRHRRASPQAARVLQVADAGRRRRVPAAGAEGRSRAAGAGRDVGLPRAHRRIRLLRDRSIPRAGARPRRRACGRRSRSSRAGTCSSSA